MVLCFCLSCVFFNFRFLIKIKEIIRVAEAEITMITEFYKNRDKYNNKKISYKNLIYSDILVDIKNNIPRKQILEKYHINNKTFNKFLIQNNISYTNRKVILNKPTKDELNILIIKTNHNLSAIGRMFNVSSNAVVKWCKKYNINYKKQK